jgi:hypothetical protein
MGNHFIQAIIKERRIEPFECDISQPELTRDFFNSIKINKKNKKAQRFRGGQQKIGDRHFYFPPSADWKVEKLGGPTFIGEVVGPYGDV